MPPAVGKEEALCRAGPITPLRLGCCAGLSGSLAGLLAVGFFFGAVPQVLVSLALFGPVRCEKLDKLSSILMR